MVGWIDEWMDGQTNLERNQHGTEEVITCTKESCLILHGPAQPVLLQSPVEVALKSELCMKITNCDH